MENFHLILIINICNSFLTKSDVFDDVNEENELEENDMLSPFAPTSNLALQYVQCGVVRSCVAMSSESNCVYLQ